MSDFPQFGKMAYGIIAAVMVLPAGVLFLVWALCK